MKILVIAHNLRSLLNFRELLLDDFVKSGHRVAVSAPEGSQDDIDRLSDKGVEFFPMLLSRAGVNILEDIQSLWRMYRIIRRCRPDAIFNIAAKPVLYGSLAAYIAGAPRVYSLLTGLGYLFLNTNFKEKVIHVIACVLFRSILPFNEKVFFQNPDDRDLFISRKFIDASKAVLLSGSGVDLNHYAYRPLDTPKPVFLMICRLIRSKGVSEYVEAARNLSGKYPEAVFRLLGGVDQNPSSYKLEQVQRWHEEGWIEYCGETLDVRPYIEGSMVYVLPSYYMEGIPRSILEALSIGRPVITTDFRGCRETVVDGSNGILVPVRDVERLSQAMERFILHPEEAVEMGRISRQVAVQKFDVRKVNHAILKEMDLIHSHSMEEKGGGEA